jgi:XRE family transcriptional regulator, fatty acid utilization regulator
MNQQLNEDRIRLIFGLKVRQLRLEKEMSLQDVADKTDLSISYLNEIEKGKKYPKADKIFALSKAFDVPYDFLVSLKLTKKLAPLGDILESGLLDEIPLDFFGVDSQKLIELIAASPAKVSAFLSTYIDMARNYDLNKEQFFSAALRSFQELNENYFKDIEEAVLACYTELGFDVQQPLSYEEIKNALTEKYETAIEEKDFSELSELNTFRTLYVPQLRKLMVNKELSEDQKKFILAKELGYHFLQLPLNERTYFYQDWVNTHSFEQALINFKASYFAGALLLPEKPLVQELKHFFDQKVFPEAYLRGLLEKWQATPETLMYRFTNLLPRHFGLNKLFFLKFHQEEDSHKYHLSKELHLNHKHSPHGNEKGEHYCRRWQSIRIFDSVNENPGAYFIGAQKSVYYDSKDEYLVLTFGRQTLKKPWSNVSINIGIELQPESKRKIKWLNDAAIRSQLVNVTCERCSINNCQERVAAPVIQEKKLQIDRVKEMITKVNNGDISFLKM